MRRRGCEEEVSYQEAFFLVQGGGLLPKKSVTPKKGNATLEPPGYTVAWLPSPLLPCRFVDLHLGPQAPIHSN